MTAVPTAVEAVRDARAAQPHWAATPVAARLALVRQIRHRLASHAMPLAALIRDARQSSLSEALASEVLPLADACRFLERRATRLLRPQRLNRGRPTWLMGIHVSVIREPFGVVLVIGPSNYPLFLAGVQAMQALVAGNAVVLKPGRMGGPVLAAFRTICLEAGLDPRLFALLDESPEAATEAVHAGVDKVLLTGSATSGQRVLETLAPLLVPATLELSGCDAVFVLADADLDQVARALYFGLHWNGSETCIAPRRVFVPHDQRQALEERIRSIMGEHASSVHRPLVPSTCSLIQEALDQGARVLLGSVDQPPLLLTNATPTMSLLRADLFAPVLAIVPVRDAEEALQAAATCPYRLGASVFGSERAARSFAQRINAGWVTINDAIVPTADPRVPFSGRGRSGFGVTRGAEGLLEVTTLKVIAVRRGRTRHLEEPHFSDHALLQHYIEATHGRRGRQRLMAFVRLVRQLLRRVFATIHQKEHKP